VKPLPVLCLLLAACLVGRVGGEGPEPAGAVDALSRTQARAVARAAASVVTIRPVGDGPEVTRKRRSGVVLAPNLVATCATHVDVFGQGELVVETASGQVVPAKLRGTDTRLRVALLEAPGLEAPSAPVSPGPHRPGTFVLGLGRALGTLTVTAGIVSIAGRFQGRALQTDAALDASNSGGALIDLEGRLVGLLVHVSDRLGSRSGVGFAVPTPRIKAVLVPLQRGFQLEPGRLGIVVPRQRGDQAGIVVRGVVPRSAAARAGVQVGDVVLAIEGQPTPDPDSFRRVVADLYAGQRVVLEVERRGASRKLPVTVEPLP
jgi:S1-C subfamily serine protease